MKLAVVENGPSLAGVTHLDVGPPSFLEHVERHLEDAFRVAEIPPSTRAILGAPRSELVVNFPVELDDGTVRVRGLPRPAQRRARPVQGRPPLPRVRVARGRQGARGAHDVEARAPRHPVRRREGRHRARPAGPFTRGAPAHHASLHACARREHRPRPRHPRARRRHEQPDDGVDHGHVLEPRRRCARAEREGRGHGQAHRLRRHRRLREGHGSGRRVRAPGMGPRDGHHAPGRDDGGPGLRQRRLASRRHPLAPGRLHHRRRRPLGLPRERGGLQRPQAPGLGREHGAIAGYPGGTPITREEFFATKADFFAPCALENQIGEAEARALSARVVIEGANGPPTPAAEKILVARGIDVLPDILANAGGVTVSYFEWVQNRRSESWTEEEVDEKLHRAITKAYRAVADFAHQHGTTRRTAAYALALQRLQSVYEERGIFP